MPHSIPWSLRCTRQFRPLALAATLVLAVLIAGIAALAYTRARRRPKGDADGLIAEFGNLSDAERCDFIFAIAALDDPSSLRLLERALDDPCETVALAAAHALTTAGSTMPLERFFAANPGRRTDRIAASLELLA
jgi:HEAT repeat protein